MSRRRNRSRSAIPSERADTGARPALPMARLLGAGVVLLYVAFAWFLANATPLVEDGSLINAPDEAAHVGYVRAIAVGHRLPMRADPEFRTYQWHQPPLYYVLASLAYSLGLPGLRAVSVLFGLISLWAMWSTARLLAPSKPDAVILATAAVALLPMRHAVYSSVGNDAAIECLFSLTMLACASVCLHGFTRARGIGLGCLLGLATLTKLSGLLLFPGAALCLILARPSVAARYRMMRALWPLALGLALAGPWFGLNVMRHGQALPISAFHAEFVNTSRATDWIGKRQVAVDAVTGDLLPGPTMDRASYSALIANWTARTFVGAYTPPSRAAIGAPSFLPVSFYACYAGLAVLGLWGIMISRPGLIRSGPHQAFALTAAVTAFLVLGSFVGFTWTYFQAQGRYLYPAQFALSWPWALGFTAAIPERYRRAGVAGVIALLVVLASAFALVYVAPAYSAR